MFINYSSTKIVHGNGVTEPVLSDREIAIMIAEQTIKFTICPPQKVSRKQRSRNAGMKNTSSRKGSKADPRGSSPAPAGANTIYQTADRLPAEKEKVKS
tara:strand:- start:3068 stop:3364 length:297 start_codon:yes stop_codon:yes gene_type:complete